MSANTIIIIHWKLAGHSGPGGLLSLRQRPMRSLLRRSTWESIVGIYRYLTVYCGYLRVPGSVFSVFTGTRQCILGIYAYGYLAVYSGYLTVPASVV